MYYDTDTLEHFKSSPLFKRQVSQHTAHSVSKVISTLIGDTLYSPDTEALRFYLLNHAWAELQGKKGVLTPSQCDVANVYISNLQDTFLRIAAYMTLIVTRESRHAGLSSTTKKILEVTYSSHFVEFLQAIQGTGSGGAVSKFKDQAPSIPLIHYLEGIREAFKRGSFSGGFGGLPWANITEVLLSCFKGDTTPEMLVDTAFTLAHNNGPIFNKGMIYSGYDTSYFIQYLDVQRSGQIPAYIKERKTRFPELHAELVSLEQNLGYSLGDSVDWYKVEALGSVKKYNKEKQAQDAKGITSTYKKEVQSSNNTPDTPEGKIYYITPTCYVSVLERKAA